MQYGSIGWSVGATLGYAQAAPEKRVIACIGDGSFQVIENRERMNCLHFPGNFMTNEIYLQMTAQDISTMLRCGQRTIIFLINNGGYTIEVEIHDGPYNVIKNWNYTGLVDAIHNGEGKCWTTKVSRSSNFQSRSLFFTPNLEWKDINILNVSTVCRFIVKKSWWKQLKQQMEQRKTVCVSLK